MNRERKLLRRAIYALHEVQAHGPMNQSKLIEDIRAELEKPEPVECGYITVRNGLQDREIDDMDDGKYRLLAEKIDAPAE